ncbi:MAG: phosphopentomutase [Ruminiclostridium sp.]|nr:phosphopentomutase [Ruminiclostridium sp.]
MAKRVFLIVLDSVGIGEMPDAKDYGDEGSNTLKACYDTGKLNVPNLKHLGLFNIEGNEYGGMADFPFAEYARMKELSKGKDTTTGHWEMMGIVSENPFPTYPDGFPADIISEFEARTGRKVICNKPYSGTDVIRDYGNEHLETGALIVYTSADSVFQIAAHEELVPVDELYRYCEIAREILVGEHGVGRVIARPFIGEHPFTRTKNRHDFSLKPTEKTYLEIISDFGLTCYGIGKINDIFAGVGLTDYVRTADNADGMKKTEEFAEKDWEGFCFVNLVDFDMSYGHRNDVEGYTNALNEFDKWLGGFMPKLRDDDVLMITADHGCDPVTPSTDHSREYTPLLVYGKNVPPQNLGTIDGFDSIGRMVLEKLGILL